MFTKDYSRPVFVNLELYLSEKTDKDPLYKVYSEEEGFLGCFLESELEVERKLGFINYLLDK